MLFSLNSKLVFRKRVTPEGIFSGQMGWILDILREGTKVKDRDEQETDRQD